jgi:hypothetical protein
MVGVKGRHHRFYGPALPPDREQSHRAMCETCIQSRGMSPQKHQTHGSLSDVGGAACGAIVLVL